MYLRRPSFRLFRRASLNFETVGDSEKMERRRYFRFHEVERDAGTVQGRHDLAPIYLPRILAVLIAS
jgi:hypothetical protein